MVNKERKQRMDGPKYKRLTRQEEIEAWERGDHDALVNSVWPLVLHLVRKLADQDSLVYHELLSDAGLIIAKALKTYDARQTRLTTYAFRFMDAQLYRRKTRFRSVANEARQAREVQGLELMQSELPPELVPSVSTRDVQIVDAADECEAVMNQLQTVCTPGQLDVMRRVANGEQHADIAAIRGVCKQASHNVMNDGLRRARKALVAARG